MHIRLHSWRGDRVVDSSVLGSASREASNDRIGLVSAALLVGQTAAPPHPGDKQKTTSKAAAEIDPGGCLAEYNCSKRRRR